MQLCRSDADNCLAARSLSPANRSDQTTGHGTYEAGAKFETFFSPYLPEPSASDLDKKPQSRYDEVMCGLFDESIKSMDICAHRWTLKKYTLKAISAKQNRGVIVRVLADKPGKSHKGSRHNPSMKSHLAEMIKLTNAGIIVKAAKQYNGHHEGLMHSKFCLFDDKHLLTGSMNLTLHGQFRNVENAIRHGSLELASHFKARFEKLWLDGHDWPSNL